MLFLFRLDHPDALPRGGAGEDKRLVLEGRNLSFMSQASLEAAHSNPTGSAAAETMLGAAR
jgi:hypothetical protein